MIKAIIFDMDGVLVDSEPFHVEIEKRQFELNHLSISEEERQQYMGIASDVMWREIAKIHNLSLPVETLIEQNRMESIHYFSELEEIQPMPGLIDLLDILTQKAYPLAVASSSFPEIIDLILERTDLRKYFQVVVSSQEAGKSKPDPDVFLLAAMRLGINPEDCLVIEDSANGIKAARSAQMQCIAYQGPSANSNQQNDVEVVVKSFDQLAQILR
jgi:beta-phosphoglucomutase